MPRLHALELVLDAEGETVVRRDWAALHDIGLPSMLDHAGATNTPHVTVLALPEIDDAIEVRAVDLIGPVLPVAVRPSGIGVLGGDKVTVARLLDVPLPLTQAVLRLREGMRERHPGWLPHVTLGRRIPRADVQRAVDVLGDADHPLILVGLRRWDPGRREVRLLTP